jgi:hypothetical protein
MPMPDKWTITSTNNRSPSLPPGTKTYTAESEFISAIQDKLDDVWTSNLSAVLPDGTELNESALREKYAKKT